MTKWLKENWFKLSTLILFLVFAVFAAIYLSNYFEEKKEFERRVACAEQVDKLRQRVPEVRRDYELIESNYNKKDKNCYAYVIDSGGNIRFYIVYDAFRASEVFQATVHPGDGGTEFYPDGIGSIDDINREAKHIMYSE